MSHAYGDHIARHGGLQLAQYLMGHADPSTTKTYVGDPRIEDLRRRSMASAWPHTARRARRGD
jgi:site-specific recombinase XerD